jgi:hypothetical protein
MSDLNFIIDTYNSEVDALPNIHKNIGGGKARNASGLVYENLNLRTCQMLGLDARKNDYKRSMIVNGKCLKNLQVDKHVYKNNVLKILLEDKTYLDVCYLKRCVLDFMELDQSPDVPDDVEYAIFAGQNGVGKDAFAYYPAYFEKYTHKKLNMFFVNPQYKRNSKRPIYKEQFRSHFDLDMVEYNRFIEWLQK